MGMEHMFGWHGNGNGVETFGNGRKGKAESHSRTPLLKVIQGLRNWYRSKARVRFPISALDVSATVSDILNYENFGSRSFSAAFTHPSNSHLSSSLWEILCDLPDEVWSQNRSFVST